ncbi:alpha/beta hydrolase [Mesorhizobium australafricanum]|uniref:Alpha/beta fold hydrolase n=1 Tax=Mesorhizobium australafricanum TaxID=3072311 RepID=A0ABU4X0Z9_9HYPH|nr:alpha/beta hydrolase [Mesorhizobium sp. VK3E]MDX8441986.1 alpha/beta fold hydrolase [Mesorhizobium sp. VK3E]
MSNTSVAQGASSHTILVATTRSRDARPGTFFDGERSSALNFASITVSVPPNHKAGNVEWPSSKPGNAQTDFVTRDGELLPNDKQFLAELNQRLKAQPKGQRKVLLFVHGYNTLFAEGLYRFAQVVHDSHAPSVPVFFSWASHGKTLDYVYDNNSATIARDGLERTLRLLLASDADEINVLAHSMGNWVTVEAFRQIKISGNVTSAGKLGTVILAAPDIDVDVFKSEMQRIGKPKKPFLIIVSRDDKALGLSRLIAGGKDRLGASKDTASLADLGAIVVDLSNVKANDATNHGKFAQVAEIAPDLRKVLAQGIPDQEEGGLAGATTRVLTLPVAAPITILTAK